MSKGEAADLVALSPEVARFLKSDLQSHIDGAPATGGGARFTLANPADGESIAEVAQAGERDLDRAIEAAHQSHADRRWAGLRPADREAVLLRLADRIAASAETLAQIETLNQGKSINVSRMIDVGASVEFVRYIAGLATKLAGRSLDPSIPVPPGARHLAYTRLQPIGPVGAIAPSNFPLMIALWKSVPALAAGCPVILKPAPETPLTALYLARLMHEVGVPDGVFNVVVDADGKLGGAIVGDPRVRQITFTGSTAVGRHVGRVAGEMIKPAILELGGKNPMIVFDDVDVDRILPGLIAGAFLNSGQVCAAGSTLLVQDTLTDTVIEALSAAIKDMKVGPGLDQSSDVTPLVTARHQRHVADSIVAAGHAGARIVQGVAGPERGNYVPATLICDIPRDAKALHEEVFGPVLNIVPFVDAKHALSLANDSAYGLAASVWTENLSLATTMSEGLEYGTVWVNNHVPVDPNLPFGGMKASGIGREFGLDAVENFTTSKTVCLSYPAS